MITVAEYNHAEQLTPFESVWNRLLDRTPEPCFSQTLDCLHAESRVEGTKLRILVAFISGRPFGILPLKVETRSTSLGTLRCLTSVGDSHLPFAGPLGPNTTAMLAAAFRHVHRTRRDWDVVEFRLGGTSEMLQKRLKNALRLVGWHCETDDTADWLEILPESVRSQEFTNRFRLKYSPANSRQGFERQRAEKTSSKPWSLLGSCLSLVEEIHGPQAAKQLQGMHQAGSRAGIADWCLLREDGLPTAAALNLLTRDGVHCTALVGRDENARLQLLKRMLEDALWRGDGPYVFPASDVPDSEQWTHATRPGFRYTHVSPWAVRARWMRFRQRIQSARPTQGILTESPPLTSPRALSLYAPETL